MHVPSKMVGCIIGRNGESINSIQSTYNVRLQFHHGMLIEDIHLILFTFITLLN